MLNIGGFLIREIPLQAINSMKIPGGKLKIDFGGKSKEGLALVSDYPDSFAALFFNVFAAKHI